MKSAAAATLPKFDTGYWTYYSLPHEPSPLDYQQYVVQLLAKLAPTDPRFAAARARGSPHTRSSRPRSWSRTAASGRCASGSRSRQRSRSSRPPVRRAACRSRAAGSTVGVKEPTRAGCLSRSRDRDRLGRQPRVVRRAADRPCRHDGFAVEGGTQRLGRSDGPDTDARRRRGAGRSEPGRARAEGGPANRSHGRRLAGRVRLPPTQASLRRCSVSRPESDWSSSWPRRRSRPTTPGVRRSPSTRRHSRSRCRACATCS